jgi:hypothetical protein
MPKNIFSKMVGLGCWCAFLFGCAMPTAQQRTNEVQSAANRLGWRALRLPAEPFVLAAWTSPAPVRIETSQDASKTLTIYIEGDGYAWRSASQPSDNPTPMAPVAWRLALQHADTTKSDKIAYLARPCQYIDAVDWGACNEAYWTDGRFSEDVVASMDTALTRLKVGAGAQRLHLVGFSGGGAVAALLAARRTDVDLLVTVAGNLDTQAWTRWHRVPALGMSLNPADRAPSLQNTVQMHFVGQSDSVMPEQIARAYAARFQKDKQPSIRLVAGANHTCCWAEKWPALMQEAGLKVR